MSDPLPTLAPPELAAHLLGGSAALFPTDTLPALASCPSQAHQLWALKHRPAEKPLILMAANAEALLGSIGQLISLSLANWTASSSFDWSTPNDDASRRSHSPLGGRYKSVVISVLT